MYPEWGTIQWPIQGRVPEGLGPTQRAWALPLILDQTEAEGPKKFFVVTWTPLSQGLDDRASPLSEGLDLPLQLLKCITIGIHLILVKAM